MLSLTRESLTLPTIVGVGAEAETALGEAITAFGAGHFEDALDAARRSVALDAPPVAYEFLGGLLYADDEFDETRGHWETAFREYRSAGDLCAAARVAIELASMHVDVYGNEAAGRGWLSRARRLLDAVGPCVEAGYYELALMACNRFDADELEQSADRALAIALEYDDPNLEVRALADAGLALVTQGRLTEGFARLDEALAAITAGEVADVTTVGKSFCSMLSACDRTGDVRRADEWTRLAREMLLVPRDGRPRVLTMHCQLAYGSVLCSAGRWPEAEAAMMAALGRDGSAVRGHRVETRARLADLRLQQGRVEESFELLRPYEDDLAAAGALARAHCAIGAYDASAAVARRALRQLNADTLRGGPLLAVLVEAEVERGNVDAADEALRELEQLVAERDVPSLAAEVASAHARVASARSDLDTALESLERARALASGEDRPFLRAVIDLDLAVVLEARGDNAAAVAEARAALSGFERLGAARRVDQCLALLRTLGATERRRPVPSAALAKLTARESEVLDLLRQGLTNAEIAQRLFISPKTAEHHVGRLLAKLGAKSRTEAVAIASSIER